MCVSALIIVHCGGTKGSDAPPATSADAAEGPSPTVLPATSTATPGLWADTTPTPPGDGEPVTVFPFRVVLTGPATAHSGEKVTYNVHYVCVSQAEANGRKACDPGLGVFVEWPPPKPL